MSSRSNSGWTPTPPAELLEGAAQLVRALPGKRVYIRLTISRDGPEGAAARTAEAGQPAPAKGTARPRAEGATPAMEPATQPRRRGRPRKNPS